ncbi:MAG: hypothetical protein VXW43_19755, partial [Pseudomonadota bacterium]|nr:hypothetical protein [Pseudomonadota bacterium]
GLVEAFTDSLDRDVTHEPVEVGDPRVTYAGFKTGDHATRLGAGCDKLELNDAREAKMKDLAKRSKQATMALGRERAKSAQLTAELAQAKRDLAKAAADGGGAGAARSSVSRQGSPRASCQSTPRAGGAHPIVKQW